MAKIKIDKMFLNDLDKDNNKKIVKSIRDLVDDINISLMASYVETIEQYYYLKDLHFDKIQGYLFSKPLEYGDYLYYTNDGKQIIFEYKTYQDFIKSMEDNSQNPSSARSASEALSKMKENRQGRTTQSTESTDSSALK